MKQPTKQAWFLTFTVWDSQNNREREIELEIIAKTKDEAKKIAIREWHEIMRLGMYSKKAEDARTAANYPQKPYLVFRKNLFDNGNF